MMGRRALGGREVPCVFGRYLIVARRDSTVSTRLVVCKRVAALAENYEAAGRTEDAARATERFSEIISRGDTLADDEPR